MNASSFDVIGWEDRPEEFLDGVTRFGITAAQFTLTSKYRKAVVGPGFRDLSFCLTAGGNIRLAVPCHKVGDTMNFNNAPLCFLGDDNDKKLIRAAYDELFRRARKSGAKSIAVADRAAGRALSVTGMESVQRHGVPACRLESAIDLSQTEEIIRSNLRERYKSLINRGRREMIISAIGKENADKKLFENFRLFHLKVSGRQTRPVESWEVQFEMIVAGCAEVVLGYMEPHGLVSSALVTDFGPVTTYAVAVYDRTLFANHPIAHANVYEGIMRAKKRGQARFVVGNVPPRGTVSDKEYSIGVFKKGFYTRLDSYIEWTIPTINGEADEGTDGFDA